MICVWNVNFPRWPAVLFPAHYEDLFLICANEAQLVELWQPVHLYLNCHWSFCWHCLCFVTGTGTILCVRANTGRPAAIRASLDYLQICQLHEVVMDFPKFSSGKLGAVKRTVTDWGVCSWPWQWFLLDKAKWLSLVCHQEPTKHTVQVNCILLSKGQYVCWQWFI